MQSLSDLTMGEAASLISRGMLLAENYMQAAISQYHCHIRLNAIVGELDESRLMAAARRVDICRQQGQCLGPLAGIPIAVKDQINVKGFPTTVGSELLSGYIPNETAAVIAKLESAGAIIFAKTVMTDSLTGGQSLAKVRNPYDLNRTTGGSSSGSAAVVSARIVPAAIGEDTAGSIRWPAAFCGISGFRPSTYCFENYFNTTDKKRYSAEGLVPPASWCDTLGPMARTVGDIALLDEVITGEKSFPLPLSKSVIGVPSETYWQNRPHESEVKLAFVDFIGRLRSAGASLVSVDLDNLIALAERDRLTRYVSKPKQSLEEWLGKNFPKLTVAEVNFTRHRNASPPNPRNYFRDSFVPPRLPAHSNERELMTTVWNTYANLFAEKGLTAIASPTMMTTAPLLDHHWAGNDKRIYVGQQWVEECDLVLTNLVWGARLGCPAITVPICLVRNLPVGLQLQGMPDSDCSVLALAASVEQLIGALPEPAFRHEPV